MALGFRSIFGPYSKDTVPGLERKFTNTPLESYLSVVIPFFWKEMHSWEESLYKDTRCGVRIYLDETLQMALLLRELKKGNAKGKGWRIESKDDILRLYDSVESLFMNKLDDLPDVLHRFEWDEFSPELFDEWEKALSDFPSSDGFEKEDKELDEEGNVVEYGDHRLDIYEIEYAIKRIKRCKKIADQFFLESDDAMAKRFVAYMIENGVPESRAMYRCWYDALDCFNGIPDEIKKSHQGLPAKSDPKGNYIKSIAVRIHSQKK